MFLIRINKKISLKFNVILLINVSNLNILNQNKNLNTKSKFFHEKINLFIIY